MVLGECALEQQSLVCTRASFSSVGDAEQESKKAGSFQRTLSRSPRQVKTGARRESEWSLAGVKLEPSAQVEAWGDEILILLVQRIYP